MSKTKTTVMTRSQWEKHPKKTLILGMPALYQAEGGVIQVILKD